VVFQLGDKLGESFEHVAAMNSLVTMGLELLILAEAKPDQEDIHLGNQYVDNFSLKVI
jgi:hypothetical protein